MNSSNPSQNAWDAALQRLRLQIKPKDLRLLERAKTFEELTISLQISNKDYIRRASVRVLEWINPVIEHLKSFEKAISSFVNSNPAIASLVWGSLIVVLELASRFNGCLESIAELLHDISKAMPRFEEYTSLFAWRPQINAAMIDIYEGYLIFCIQAMHLLQKPPIWILAKMIWKPMNANFKAAVSRIEKDVLEMEREANASNIRIGFDREAQAQTRNDELIATLTGTIPISTLPCIDIPYQRNAKFFGRTSVLREMHEHLAQSGVGSIENLKSLTIQGLGGLGKTQTAQEYAFRNRSEYDAIFWLRAEEPVVLLHDYSRIAKVLRISKSIDENTDQKREASLVKDWLSKTEVKWLLIFDNADHKTDLKAYWPTTGRGSIVITTRDRDVADTWSAKQISLGPFDPEEGSQFLLQQIGGPDVSSTDLTKTITEDMGGLPLAIAQSAGFIRQTRCTLADFNKMYQKRIHSSRIYADQESITSIDYRLTLETCFDISLELLTDELRDLLNILVFFQTDSIPEELYLSGCEEVESLRFMRDPFERNNAIRQLSKHSLVVRFNEDGDSSLWIHRVVKRNAIHRLDLDKAYRQRIVEQALALLRKTFPGRPSKGDTMGKKWIICEKFLPHVLSLNAVAKESDPPITPTITLAEVLADCGYYLWERSLERDAITILQQASEVCDVVLTLEDPNPVRSDILIILASLQLVTFQGRAEGARLLQVAYDIRKRHFARLTEEEKSTDEIIQLANSTNNVGCSYLTAHEYDKALDFFERSFEIKKTLGTAEELPYEYGLSNHNIGQVCTHQRKLQKAKHHLKLGSDLVEGAVGPDNFRSNAFRHSYAEACAALGEIDEALALHVKTLESRERVMGEGNNDVGVSYYALAFIYHTQNRLTDAE